MSAMRAPATDEVIIVRPCSSFEDCDSVARLCGSAFPEECAGQGLSVQQWAAVEADSLRTRPSWWNQIGELKNGGRADGGTVAGTWHTQRPDALSAQGRRLLSS